MINILVTLVLTIILMGMAIYSRKNLIKLTAFIVFLTIISNLVIVPQYSFAGMSAAQVTFAFIPLMTDLISERWGRKEAMAVVKINSIVNIMLMVTLNVILLVTPLAGYEWAHDAQMTLFAIFIPMTISGITAYAISNTLDVYLYDWVASKTKNVYIRSFGSTMISQAIDTTILVTMASIMSTMIMGFSVFAGVMIPSILVMYGTKMFVVIFGAKLVSILSRGENDSFITEE